MRRGAISTGARLRLRVVAATVAGARDGAARPERPGRAVGHSPGSARVPGPRNDKPAPTRTRASGTRPRTVVVGASWQRCRTHFMRNLLTRVPKSAEKLVATTVRTTYEQPSAAEVGTIALRWVNVPEGARFAVGDEARVSRRTASPGRQGRG